MCGEVPFPHGGAEMEILGDQKDMGSMPFLRTWPWKRLAYVGTPW